MGNKNLRQARKAKNDEFYTQLSTIEDGQLVVPYMRILIRSKNVNYK